MVRLRIGITANHDKEEKILQTGASITSTSATTQPPAKSTLPRFYLIAGSATSSFTTKAEGYSATKSACNVYASNRVLKSPTRNL